jgi:hypothetical protein
MSSSNDLLTEFARISTAARDPGFVVVVAFDYYDGPEHGLALYPSGEGVRFASLGDSNSRTFRAFELIPIHGSWWPKVRGLQHAEGIDPPSRVLVPGEANDTLKQLQRAVHDATGVGQFVGVGAPDLGRLSVSKVAEEQLIALRQLGGSPDAFRLAHQLAKGRAADD